MPLARRNDNKKKKPVSETDSPDGPNDHFPGPLEAWWSPRRKRFWAWILLLAYTLGGFFLAPWLAKRELLALIEAETGLPASVEELRINPFVLSAEATGFALRETDGREFISFDRLFLNFQLRSIVKRALVFREVTLEAPKVDVLRAENGDVNLVRLAGQPAEPPPPDEEPSGLLRLLVDQLDISDGEVFLTDQVPPTDFTTELGPVDIALSNLSTLPEDSGEQRVLISTPRGARLEWSGDISVNPIASRGRVTGSGPYLPLAYQYLQDDVNFEVVEGQAEIGFDYAIDWPDGAELDVEISNLDLDVRGVKARAPFAPRDFLELPEVSVRGAYLRLGEQAAGADSYVMRSPRLRLARYADGSLSLEKLVPAAAADTAGATPPEDAASASPAVGPAGAPLPADDMAVAESELAAGWQLGLGRLEIDQMTVEFEDQALSGEPAQIVIDPLRVELRDLSNQPGAVSPLSVSAVLGSGGQADLDGELTLLPDLSVDARLELGQVALAVAQPYLSEFARMTLNDGALDAQFAIANNPDEPLSADGGLSVSQLEIADAVKEERLLGWQSLMVDRLKFSLAENRLDISEVALAAPYARLLIDEDGSTNFQQLIFEQPEAAAAAEAEAGEAEPSEPLAATLAKITIADGSADFSDRNLPFAFATEITELEGSISTLATASSEPAQVDLQGRVAEYGLAEISGSLSPADPTLNSDLSVLFRNVELPDLSAYTVKFAGRRIQDGRMDLDLRYRLDEGKLQGDNSVVIDRLTLGEKEDYPGAANLPLGLAIALLKKPDGTIDIDLPVTGDVDDPEFSIGGVVFRAFANLVTKIATAPFRLLGGLVGAGADEQIDLVEFRAGEAELTPPEQEKLAKLAEALAMRPQLAIEVPGVVDAEADTAALREQRLDAAVEELLAAETGGRAEDLLTVRQRRALEELAQAQLPEGAIESAQAGAQRLEDPENPDSRLVLDEPAYLANLRGALVDAQSVTESDLAELSTQRANAIVAVLVEAGQVDAARVRVLPGKEAEQTDGGWIPLKLEAQAASGE